MQKLFKRSLAWVLALMMVVTMFSGAISVAAETEIVEVMFNDCDNFKNDSGTEIIANPNSGSVNMEVADGHAKFWYKNDGSKADFPMTVRNSGGIVFADYDALKFDIYISEGMEIIAPTGSDWGGSINFATGFGGIDANKVTSVGAECFYDLAIGQWNTVTIPTSEIETDASIVQIVFRPYCIFAGDTTDYVLLDNVRLAKEVEVEDSVGIEKVQLRSCDSTGWQNSPRGEFFANTSNYTEGNGSITVGLDKRSGTKIMNAWLGSIDNRTAVTDCVDISSLIDETGSFYMTFDFWADPAKLAELSAGRFVVGVVARGPQQTTESMDSGKECIEIDKAQNADWSVWGIENLKAGWNHLSTKITIADGVCNYPHKTNSIADYWDATKIWAVKFNYQQLNWEDPADFTYNIGLDDISFMSVESYEAHKDGINAAKDIVSAICDVDLSDTAAVAAIQAKYDALDETYQALVSNAAKLSAKPYNQQIASWDGNQGHVLATGARGYNWPTEALEGTNCFKAVYDQADANGLKKMYLSAMGLNADIPAGSYLTFDLYLHNVAYTGAGDTILRIGTGENWNAEDIAALRGGIKAASAKFKEGWNHVVIPLVKDDGTQIEATGVNVIGLVYELSVNAATDSYFIVDDWRIINDVAMAAHEKTNVAKDATAAIYAIPAVDALTLEDKATVDAAAAAVAAVDAEYTSYIKGADVLAAAQAKIAELESAGPVDINAGRIPWHDFVTHGENHALTNLSDGFWLPADQAPSGQKSIGGKLNAGANDANIIHMAPNAPTDASQAAYVAFDVYVDKDIPASALADAGVNIGDGNSWDNWGKVTDSFASAIRENGGLQAGWNLFILPVHEWAANAHNNAVQCGRVYLVLNTTDYNGTQFSVNDLVFYTEAGYETAVERNKAKAATIALWKIPAVDALTLKDKAVVDAAAAAVAAVHTDFAGLIKGADVLAPAQAKIAELEESAMPNLAELQLRNCDTVGFNNSPRGEFYADSATFTEGKASILTDLDFRSGSKLMNAWLGKTDVTDTLDITSLYNKDGDFYLTLDLWADPEYINSAKDYNQETGEISQTVNGGLNAGRFVLQIYAKNDAQTSANLDNAIPAMEIIKPAGTDWSIFGIDTLEAGWNHLSIKLTDNGETLSYLKTNKDGTDNKAYWDASKIWGVKFNYDGLNWFDPKEAHGTVHVRFDDITFMSVDSYNANFAAKNAAKAVITAICELPKDATAETPEVVAVQQAYGALDDSQKALVTNWSVVDKILNPPEAIDIQLHAMDKTANVVIAGGSQANYGADGELIHNNYVEGTGANLSGWTSAGANKELRMSITQVGPVDLSTVDYLVFDMYVEGWNHAWTNGKNDCNILFGSTNGANDWMASDLGAMGNNYVSRYFDAVQEGWNHLVIPIPANMKSGEMRVVQIYSTACQVTGENGGWIVFDDFRVMNEAALAKEANRNAAKAVIAKIAAVEALGTEEFDAAVAAYNELTEAQQALVTNYDKIAELQAAPAEAKVVIDAIAALLGGHTTMFHNVEGLDYVVNFSSPTNIALAEGQGNNGGNAVKISQTKDGAQEHNIGVRVPEAVSAAGVAGVRFDLYLSEGLTFNAEGWGNLSVQVADSVGGDNDLAGAQGNVKIAMKDYLKDCVTGWNTVTIPVAPDADKSIKQICMRFFSNFTGATDTYLMLDNVRLVYAENEITYADKEAIKAVETAYKALSDIAKPLVTNVETLNELLAYISTQEELAANVTNAIKALPAVDAVTLEDEAAVNAAKKALDELEADTKAALIAQEDIAALDALLAKIDDLKHQTPVDQVVAPTVAAITALPAAADIRTEHKAAVESADALVAGLTEEAVAYLQEEYADLVQKLADVKAALVEEIAFEAAAQEIITAIANLPAAPKASDEEAVNAVKAQFDNLAADVQYYVTNKAVLDAALAAIAQDKIDIQEAAAVTEQIATLPEKVTADNMAAVDAVWDAYEALTANSKGYIATEDLNKLNEAHRASVMLKPVDVQFRALDKGGSDRAPAGAAGYDSHTLDKVEYLEGTSSFKATWNSAKSGDTHFCFYHYNQSWDEQVTVDGTSLVPVTNAGRGKMYITFDFYVSDIDVLKSVTGDAGMGIDVIEPNKWGDGAKVDKPTLMPIVNAMNDGWNHVALPLTWNDNYTGKFVEVKDFRLYFVGVNIPSDFVVRWDDIRFMSIDAVETILPQRSAAKDLTLAIRALAEDYSFEDGKAIVKAYNELGAEYQSIVIGYDAFYEEFVTKYYEELKAELEANMAAAKPVQDKIDELTASSDLFQDCEALVIDGVERIANLNSGADDKALAEGAGIDGSNAAKFIKKTAGNTEFNEAFRHNGDGVDIMNAKTFEFDLYISEGMTIEPAWSPVYFNTAHSNGNNEGEIGNIDMKDLMGEWKAGQWNHVKIDLSSIKKMMRSKPITQVSIRLYKTLGGEAGDYIMIDNLVFVGDKVITTADKTAVEEARKAYDDLTAEQKALVANYDALVKAEADLAAALAAEKEAADKAAAAAVEEKINALPATITVDNKEAVEGAKADFDNLTADQAGYVSDDAKAKLNKAVEDLAAALKAKADEEAVKNVTDLIEAFPENITPADADAVNAAKQAFDNLTEEQKNMVSAEFKAALEAALAAIVAPEYTWGDVNEDGSIDAVDALWVLQAAVDKRELNDAQTAAADVDGSNVLDAVDALYILQYAVKTIEKFPVEA